MTPAGGLPPAAERVRAALAARGTDAEIRLFPASTRTAAEAAAAIGCTVAQIAKSLIFRAAATGRPVLVIASGANRIDEARVARALPEGDGAAGLARADADYVRGATGYAIGGVPPVGHATEPLVVIDRDLLSLGEVWAAAGTPNAVFRTTPAELERLTGGVVAEVKQQPAA